MRGFMGMIILAGTLMVAEQSPVLSGQQAWENWMIQQAPVLSQLPSSWSQQPLQPFQQIPRVEEDLEGQLAPWPQQQQQPSRVQEAPQMNMNQHVAQEQPQAQFFQPYQVPSYPQFQVQETVYRPVESSQPQNNANRAVENQQPQQQYRPQQNYPEMEYQYLPVQLPYYYPQYQQPQELPQPTYEASKPQQPFEAVKPQVQQPYEAPKPQVPQSYEAPKPQAQQPYEAPKPQAQRPYEAPKPQVSQSYEAPRPQVQQPYEAPKPQAQRPYEAPKPQAPQSYEAPRPQVQQPYEAPKPQPQPSYPQNYRVESEVNTPVVVPGMPDSRCPRSDDPEKPVHFPIRGNCHKFAKCFGGRAYEMDCPAGLDFDAANNRCDYPELAGCSGF